MCAWDYIGSGVMGRNSNVLPRLPVGCFNHVMSTRAGTVPIFVFSSLEILRGNGRSDTVYIIMVIDIVLYTDNKY